MASIQPDSLSRLRASHHYSSKNHRLPATTSSLLLVKAKSRRGLKSDTVGWKRVVIIRANCRFSDWPAPGVLSSSVLSFERTWSVVLKPE